MSWTPYETGWGNGWIGWSKAGTIDRIVLPGQATPVETAPEPPQIVRRLAGELTAYFSGRGELPPGDEFIDAASATAFDEAVYRAVAAIPVGEIMSYSEVASHIGRPGAARAVGAAMAKNRFAPMIPCHRVVGSDGSLRGYAGGLAMKRRLLEMEAAGA